MYNYSQIKDVHLEITSKCQARCPMCPRRIGGGPLNPLIHLVEINLDTFKKWFPTEFLIQLESLFMCGNLGDPIIAQDTLEIYRYIRSINPKIRLAMHTNGSARDPEWWEELAKEKVKTTFGIDGLADTHHLYRVSTNWEKIITNAKAFIKAGGFAKWHMLVFKHNEHQVEECQTMSRELGFKSFSYKHTSRFKSDKFHVIDEMGRTTHILEPSKKSFEMIDKIKEAKITPCAIDCKAKKYSQIYISADGTVSPCCWLDLRWTIPTSDARVDYMDQIGEFANLHNKSLKEIFDSQFFRKIEATWTNKPLIECSKQCGKFDRLGEQFETQY
jgi:MoaA/NifB/PqqE/SkfB family radical SAM enzyme